MFNKKIILLITIVMVLVNGCVEDRPCRVGFNEDCDCNIQEGIKKYRIEFLQQDKCNCCWDNPYLNDKGYYEINSTCIGGDTYYEEICYG